LLPECCKAQNPPGRLRLLGTLPPQAALDDEEELIPSFRNVRKPKRKWMSVTDLVTEIEKAMVGGERMDSASAEYENLQQEATRLRMDNDALLVEIERLKLTRAQHVALESQILAKLNEDGKFALHHQDQQVEITRKIQEVDFELAALRYQHLQNVRDVGTLKRAMSRVAVRGEVAALLTRVEAALQRGEVLRKDGPEALGVSRLITRLQDQFDKTAMKSATYSRHIANMLNDTGPLTFSGSGDEMEKTQVQLMSKLKQAKRMVAQLSRLDDIQVLNAQELGRLHRILATLVRHESVRSLIAGGDAHLIASKVAVLQEDNSRLRRTIEEIESGLDTHAREAYSISDNLRTMKDVLTPETGRLREKLVETIHQEEQGMGRLAVLRGEMVRNFRFLGMLSSALERSE